MECPYCGAELYQEDTWFRGTVCTEMSKMGEIYRCPNHEGFPSEEEARTYLTDTYTGIERTTIRDAVEILEGRLPGTVEELFPTWEEIVCDSASHHVSGSFYTDKYGALHEGYPC